MIGLTSKSADGYVPCLPLDQRHAEAEIILPAGWQVPAARDGRQPLGTLLQLPPRKTRNGVPGAPGRPADGDDA